MRVLGIYSLHTVNNRPHLQATQEERYPHHSKTIQQNSIPSQIKKGQTALNTKFGHMEKSLAYIVQFALTEWDDKSPLEFQNTSEEQDRRSSNEKWLNAQ